MCQFKFCAGAHACFLKDVSPCPAAPKTNPDDEAIEFGKQAELLGLRGKGFLDRDQLIMALGLEDHTPAKVQETAKIVRITSKLRDAVANVGTRLAS